VIYAHPTNWTRAQRSGPGRRGPGEAAVSGRSSGPKRQPTVGQDQTVAAVNGEATTDGSGRRPTEDGRGMASGHVAAELAQKRGRKRGRRQQPSASMGKSSGSGLRQRRRPRSNAPESVPLESVEDVYMPRKASGWASGRTKESASQSSWSLPMRGLSSAGTACLLHVRRRGARATQRNGRGDALCGLEEALERLESAM